MKCDSVVIEPGCLVSDTDVAQEEEVQAESTTGAVSDYASIVSPEMGVEGVHLKFHITESAGWLGSDNRLYFLEGFSVARQGAANRQCNDRCG